MEYWTDPASETFGNVYRSGLKAGFSPTYSKNLLNVAPKWLTTYIDQTNYTKDHIIQGVQALAKSAPNAKSPDDTRLKAYELLAKFQGLGDKASTTTINIVQPILNGESMKNRPPKEVIEGEVVSLADTDASLDTSLNTSTDSLTPHHVVPLIPED